MLALCMVPTFAKPLAASAITSAYVAVGYASQCPAYNSTPSIVDSAAFSPVGMTAELNA